MSQPRVTAAFLNIGHAVDHLMMLIFPTVVLAMTASFGSDYRAMLPLSLGGFIAFGAGALPAGWLGDHWGRRPMMIVFFIGIGAAGMLTSLAQTPWQIAAGLTLVGLFGSIYHPVGIAMLVKDQKRLGRALGWNGLCGNLGVAFAALSAGALSDLAGWRAAYAVPGAIAIAIGVTFAWLVPSVPAPAGTVARGTRRVTHDDETRRVFVLLTIATICGAVVFNATTIAMPKLFDVRLIALVHTTFGVGLLVCFVYVIAAFAQLLVGWLIDDRPLRDVFLPLALLLAPLLLLAGALSNWPMLAVSVAMMFVVFGFIPITDAMVARYAHDAWRSRVYAVRYLVSLVASSIAVPLVAFLPPERAGFVWIFAVLLVFAAGILATAWLFPRGTRAATPAVAEAAE
ncbi:MAG TPA: MFS transporter [Stellaceae bacterium]|nr:MFS transporter [Stellaceae bacterium]